MWFLGSGAQCLIAPGHLGPSQSRDQACFSCLGSQTLYHWTTREALNIPFNITLIFNRDSCENSDPYFRRKCVNTHHTHTHTYGAEILLLLLLHISSLSRHPACLFRRKTDPMDHCVVMTLQTGSWPLRMNCSLEWRVWVHGRLGRKGRNVAWRSHSALFGEH